MTTISVKAHERRTADKQPDPLQAIIDARRAAYARRWRIAEAKPSQEPGPVYIAPAGALSQIVEQLSALAKRAANIGGHANG
jgi:hypothetical protein